MPESIKSKLTLESVDRLHAEFQHPYPFMSGKDTEVRAVTVERKWWEQNGRPMAVTASVEIKPEASN